MAVMFSLVALIFTFGGILVLRLCVLKHEGYCGNNVGF